MMHIWKFIKFLILFTSVHCWRFSNERVFLKSTVKGIHYTQTKYREEYVELYINLTWITNINDLVFLRYKSKWKSRQRFHKASYFILNSSFCFTKLTHKQEKKERKKVTGKVKTAKTKKVMVWCLEEEGGSERNTVAGLIKSL